MSNHESTQQEPTMEEILASIRRIISEDGEEGAQAADVNGQHDPSGAEPVQPAPMEEPQPLHASSGNGSADVLELTQVLADEASTPAPANDPVAEDVQPTPEPVQPEPVAQATFEQPQERREDPALNSTPAVRDYADDDLMVVDREDEAEASNALVSADVEDATAAAFGTLGRDLAITDNPNQTLEGMVQEMMRPMLKDWLDQNLAQIVEEAVAQEVSRIAARRRR